MKMNKIFEKYSKFSSNLKKTNESYYTISEDELIEKIKDLDLSSEKENEYISNLEKGMYDLDIIATLLEEYETDLKCLLEHWEDSVYITDLYAVWDLFVEDVDMTKENLEELIESRAKKSDFYNFINPENVAEKFGEYIKEKFDENGGYAGYLGYIWVDEKAVYSEC